MTENSLPFNVMTPNFLVVVNVLLPIRCHIGSSKPFLCIFVEDVFVLHVLGAMPI